MTERKSGGGAGYHPGAPAQKIAAATKRQDRPERTAADRLPAVTATAVPPAGRRALWMLWVASCCHCSLAHLHRSGSPTGGVRDAGCGRGAYYVRVVRAQGRGAAA